jgi:voltage-gated potassium channel
MSFVFNQVIERAGLYTIDEFGVGNYKTRFVALMSIALMLSLMLSLGFVTYWAELGAEGATIKDFGDALWLMVMSSTTIGFGSQYPVTIIGRCMVTLMFIFGVGIIGGLGALFASKIFGFSDTGIKNRELRKQNSEIYEKLLAVEKLLKKG